MRKVETTELRMVAAGDTSLSFSDILKFFKAWTPDDAKENWTYTGNVATLVFNIKEFTLKYTISFLKLFGVDSDAFKFENTISFKSLFAK